MEAFGEAHAYVDVCVTHLPNQKPLFLIGPLPPPPSKSMEVASKDHGEKVIAFLDQAVESSGKRSVIFIR